MRSPLAEGLLAAALYVLLPGAIAAAILLAHAAAPAPKAEPAGIVADDPRADACDDVRFLSGDLDRMDGALIGEDRPIRPELRAIYLRACSPGADPLRR